MSARARPEDFLELVERSRRGRLKIYLGFAAGVGKTFRMLEEAQALRSRGVDVVVGVVVSHGRAETEARVGDLESVPLRRIEYRGVTVEEMDLDAVLARRPAVALVDEVAHTNAPGSKHRKRYLDILELLDAGINVICAFNVQHLESLNDLVERTTGVTVRETVPDSFVKQADQIITLDLAVEDLLDRLKAGKIYAPDKVPWALEHFFTERNLATLRELVLREVAESIERATSPATQAGAAAPAAAGKIMVCLASASPRGPQLLRRGSRLAGKLSTDWYVVYVETPSESPERIDAAAQRQLHHNITLARELGAELVRLKGHDPVQAMLDFARSHAVGHIMLGRSQRNLWARLFRRDVFARMIDEATSFDLHVVALEDGEAAR
jgi:two-component system, OmpR family, sensor histidine kinase KdpD